MQPTLPPVWSEIERYRRRRGRVTLAELSEITARAHQMHMQELRRLREVHARLDWPRVHRPEILLYTPNQLRQLIRLGNAAEAAAEAAAAQPTVGSSWRPGPLGAPWHLPDNNPSSETSASRPASSEWWSWRGWGAGALLLVAALLLVRATDRCFTRNYARSRRRRSEEWPTPNVLATSSNRHPLSMDAETSHNEFDAYPSESSDSSNDMLFNADLPPPYSECADKHITREEPPPPYSACYVAFSNPKDGTPSVTFLNSQRQNMFENDDPTSTRFTNAQTSTEELTEIAHSSNGFNHFDTGQIPNNPIGDRIYKLPYFDNTNIETDDSDECNGECIANSVECINIGPAPIASQDMTIDISDVSIDVEDRNSTAC